MVKKKTKSELEKELVRVWREWHGRDECAWLPDPSVSFRKAFFACAKFIQGKS